MCFLVLDDRSACIEVSMFPECYEKYGSKVSADELLVIEGEVQSDEFSGGVSLRAEKVYSIAQARQKFSRGVLIDLTQTPMPEDFGQRLKQIISPYTAQQSGCSVAVLYQAEIASARIALGHNWCVDASDDLLRCLREEFGGCVRLEYATAS